MRIKDGQRSSWLPGWYTRWRESQRPLVLRVQDQVPVPVVGEHYEGPGTRGAPIRFRFISRRAVVGRLTSPSRNGEERLWKAQRLCDTFGWATLDFLAASLDSTQWDAQALLALVLEELAWRGQGAPERLEQGAQAAERLAGSPSPFVSRPARAALQELLGFREARMATVITTDIAPEVSARRLGRCSAREFSELLEGDPPEPFRLMKLFNWTVLDDVIHRAASDDPIHQIQAVLALRMLHLQVLSEPVARFQDLEDALFTAAWLQEHGQTEQVRDLAAHATAILAALRPEPSAPGNPSPDEMNAALLAYARPLLTSPFPSARISAPHACARALGIETLREADSMSSRTEPHAKEAAARLLCGMVDVGVEFPRIALTHALWLARAMGARETGEAQRQALLAEAALLAVQPIGTPRVSISLADDRIRALRVLMQNPEQQVARAAAQSSHRLLGSRAAELISQIQTDPRSQYAASELLEEIAGRYIPKPLEARLKEQLSLSAEWLSQNAQDPNVVNTARTMLARLFSDPAAGGAKDSARGKSVVELLRDPVFAVAEAGARAVVETFGAAAIGIFAEALDEADVTTTTRGAVLAGLCAMSHSHDLSPFHARHAIGLLRMLSPQLDEMDAGEAADAIGAFETTIMLSTSSARREGKLLQFPGGEP